MVWQYPARCTFLRRPLCEFGELSLARDTIYERALCHPIPSDIPGYHPRRAHVWLMLLARGFSNFADSQHMLEAEKIS